VIACENFVGGAKFFLTNSANLVILIIVEGLRSTTASQPNAQNQDISVIRAAEDGKTHRIAAIL